MESSSTKPTTHFIECHDSAGKVDIVNILASIIKESILMDYFDLLDILDNGTPDEVNEAELELLGRVLYYEGD